MTIARLRKEFERRGRGNNFDEDWANGLISRLKARSSGSIRISWDSGAAKAIVAYIEAAYPYAARYYGVESPDKDDDDRWYDSWVGTQYCGYEIVWE